MTRLALLVLACAVLAPDAAAARKANRLKLAAPVAEPERKTVRTILFDSKWKQHPTFEQRWAGEGK